MTMAVSNFIVFLNAVPVSMSGRDAVLSAGNAAIITTGTSNIMTYAIMIMTAARSAPGEADEAQG